MKKKKFINMRVIKYMLRMAKENKPELFVSYFLSLIAMLLQTIQSIIIPKFLIDELVRIYNGADISEHIKSVIFYVALEICISFLSKILEIIAQRIKSLCNEWFDEYFKREINNFSMNLDFELTESPATLDLLNKAKEGMSWYSGNVCGILDQFYSIITNAIILVETVVIIAMFAPILIPIEVASSVCRFFLNRKIKKIELKSFQDLSKFNRIFGYIYFELTDPTYGKDIRLYKSANLFNKQAKEILDNQQKIYDTQAKEIGIQNYRVNVADVIFNFAIYFYIGFIALKKIISIGDISLCISSSSQFSNSLDEITRALLNLEQRSFYAENYLNFIELPQAQKKGTKKILDDKNHEIEFKNVSFKYPRSENFVLKNINIKIPFGEHLAIVGLNGAGKTTFIKLLCRLYDVTEGEILIDGINIKEYSDEEYRKLFAVLFQDFKIFAFSIKENIAFDENVDDKNIDDVLKLVNLYDYVQTLPEKNSTCISKSFTEKGTDFSGGQKQKVGIARALYKKSPIIIFDEPTAALDPIAEAEIYSDFNENLAGGKTAIYISHRLSSCKFCDKIAVFSENKIMEYGNHNELMKLKNGVYKKMFTTQANLYKKENLL